jgi:hypothetical protein
MKYPPNSKKYFVFNKRIGIATRIWALSPEDACIKLHWTPEECLVEESPNIYARSKRAKNIPPLQ